MPSRQLDFPVFDADNHMYETPDALTKYLPEEYAGLVKYVQVNGRTKIAVRVASPTTSRTRRSRGRRARARRRSTSGAATPRARPAARSWARRSRRSPAFREPGPRLELMDELGLDRALMWPTLASLVEERLRDDPDAIHVVIHALNQWMHEHVDLQLRGPHLPDAGHHAADRREGDRGARVGARARRQDHPRSVPRRCPASEGRVRSRCRSSIRSGSWCKRPTSSSACTRPTAATSATSTSGKASATTSSPRSPAAARSRRSSGAHHRAIIDAMASCVGHGLCTRFPKLQDRARSRTARVGAPAARTTWSRPTSSTRTCSRRTPSRCSSATSACTRSTRTTRRASCELHRRRQRAVRLRLPAPRGHGRPARLRRRRSTGLPQEDVGQGHGRQPRPAHERRVGHADVVSGEFGARTRPDHPAVVMAGVRQTDHLSRARRALEPARPAVARPRPAARRPHRDPAAQPSRVLRRGVGGAAQRVCTTRRSTGTSPRPRRPTSSATAGRARGGVARAARRRAPTSTSRSRWWSAATSTGGSRTRRRWRRSGHAARRRARRRRHVLFVGHHRPCPRGSCSRCASRRSATSRRWLAYKSPIANGPTRSTCRRRRCTTRRPSSSARLAHRVGAHRRGDGAVGSRGLPALHRAVPHQPARSSCRRCSCAC